MKKICLCLKNKTMRRILVIDDDKISRILIYHFLKSENIDLVLADDGFSGLQLAKELRPDLILCNIVMPGIQGYEVLRELRREATTAQIPFIFITAKSNLNNYYKAGNLGANDYLTKPLDRTQLLQAIANF
jgi:CheY-like chemotaxis protein